jgi:hypothetical protein
MRLAAICGMVLSFSTFTLAQDPWRVDPEHYKVEFEKDQVRVVRVHFEPHYKSVMNQTPARVVIVLTDERVKITSPDGESAERHLKAGTTFWSEGGRGLVENLSDQPFELIWVIPKTLPKQ